MNGAAAATRSALVAVGANRLRLLRDGAEAYPAMLDAIAGAAREIVLEMYWIGRDRAGQRFRDALTERARAGVRVCVSYDGAGSFALDAGWWTELVAAGGQVREFRPLSPFQPRFRVGRMLFRDHRKILVVDREIAFVGGINIADPWEPPDAPQHAWRDDAVEVRGPVAAELHQIFLRTWQRLGGERHRRGRDRTQERVAGARVCVIANHIGLRPDRLIRRVYLLAVHRARLRIDIAAAYFMPGPSMLHALRRAAARGVQVRIMIPRRSDMPIVNLATSSILGRLLGSGVHVYVYGARTLHAKTAVIDGKFVTIGSHNLDSLSSRLNLECNLAIADPDFAHVVEASFARDLEDAEELDLARWKRRPAWLRLLAWFAALFRPLL